MAHPTLVYQKKVEAHMSDTYFNTLNYTLANEDTALERDLLRSGCNHVLSVAGSGARVLPLFSRHPHKVTVADLSREQLLLTELRIESARHFDRGDFLAFWGYPPRSISPQERKELFNQLQMSSECRELFNGIFSANGYQSVLYSGRWERTFSKISKMCRAALSDSVEQLFSFTDEFEFRRYLALEFPAWRWNALVFLIGNSRFFNTLLYRGRFPPKNTPGSHYGFYRAAYDRIFSQGLPRENFFLQLTFLGEIRFAEGNPIECHPEVFEDIQSGIRSAEIEYKLGSVIDIVEQNRDVPIDFVSLSDVPSYFDEKTAHDFLQRMMPGLSQDALVVARYYLRILKGIDDSGYVQLSFEFDRFFAAEKTQMYTTDVFKRQSA
ncbi:MAG: DUF3419 family protein [Betaproteobacteria bacterium]|nr:DUF3419 family protein [Betaproteobacteria bacterium]